MREEKRWLRHENGLSPILFWLQIIILDLKKTN